MKLDEATADRLRELGATDDMVRWLEHPDAVRELLTYTPTTEGDDCAGCGVSAFISSDGRVGRAHLRSCEVVGAWRHLGDKRAAADLIAAELEAWVEHNRRGQFGPARNWGIHIDSSPLVRDGEVIALQLNRQPSDAWHALPDEMRRRFPYCP